MRYWGQTYIPLEITLVRYCKGVIQHRLHGRMDVHLPLGPKFSTSASVQAEMQSALETTLAKKNSEPTAPPHSGPSVRLIMTGLS